MRKLIIGFVVGLGLVSVGCATETQTVTQAASAAQETESSAAAVVVTNVPSPTEAPKLDGTWKLTGCDLHLFVGGGDYSLLVGAVSVKNTGNVPALITVGMKWDALPGPLFDGGTKQATLKPGASKQLNFVDKNVSMDDVDRIQSSPGYNSYQDSKFCKVSASIKNV
jgi:hypothetical protein